MFRVDPARVPAAGIRARCSVCGGVISVTGDGAAAGGGASVGAPAAPSVKRPAAAGQMDIGGSTFAGDGGVAVIESGPAALPGRAPSPMAPAVRPIPAAPGTAAPVAPPIR